jgi:hypothetical protein
MISVLSHQQLLSGNKLFSIFLFLFIFGACSPKIIPSAPKSPATKPTVQKPVEEEKAVIKKPIEAQEMVISLLMPFELGTFNYQTASLKDLDKAKIAIDFYQGFKMALDSVAKTAIVNYKLQVYDSKDDPSKLGDLASKAGVKNSDLIVGPVFPSGIKTFATYSKAMKKPVVSPLAASDPDIFNNPYLITINNSIDLHALKAVSFIKNQLKPKKVILVRSGQVDEYKYAVPFKKGMDSLVKGITFAEIGIKAIGFENVYKSLNPVGLNVIILPSTDRVFLQTLFKELDKLRDNFQIAVIGHPGWEKAAFLDIKLLERCNTYLTSSYQIDYKANRSLIFIKNYRTQFSLEPSEYAFKGFDIGFYFAKLMNEKGKDFMVEITKQSFDGLHNNFTFIKHPQFGYYNNNLMVLKYQQGQLKNVN